MLLFSISYVNKIFLPVYLQQYLPGYPIRDLMKIKVYPISPEIRLQFIYYLYSHLNYIVYQNWI